MSVEAPIQADARWFRGEDKVLRWAVVDDQGATQDVTGWSVRWTFRQRRTDDAPALELDAEVVDGAGGVVEVAVAAAQTDDLLPGTYHYVLRRVDAGANQVLAFGPAVLREVSDA